VAFEVAVSAAIASDSHTSPVAGVAVVATMMAVVAGSPCLAVVVAMVAVVAAIAVVASLPGLVVAASLELSLLSFSDKKCISYYRYIWYTVG